MKTKNEYIDSLAAELKEWSAKIDALALKADLAAEHVKQQYAEEIAELRSKRQAAADQIDTLEASSEDAWTAVKATSDKMWEEFKAGINAAASKYD